MKYIFEDEKRDAEAQQRYTEPFARAWWDAHDQAVMAVMAGEAGFEPATTRLTARCRPAWLPWNTRPPNATFDSTACSITPLVRVAIRSGLTFIAAAPVMLVGVNRAVNRRPSPRLSMLTGVAAFCLQL